MNALFGMPDVKTMQYRRITLHSVLNGLCSVNTDVKCYFVGSRGCNHCISGRIWIKESMMPAYLAHRLVEGAS